jgi:DNA-binding MarR family transcriptional regulator
VGDVDPEAVHVLLPELSVIPGHLIWRSAARVTAALADSLPPGVEIHAYAALLALAAGRARSQQWLADSVATSRTTMAKVAADLVDQGLVERVRNTDDRRSYALTRTPAGAAAARRWRRHVEDLEEALTSGLSQAEREDLGGLLHRVAEPRLSPETPDALRESIPFLITRIHGWNHAELLATLRDLGVEPRHTGALVALRARGAIAQAELARSLGTSGATVVEIVDHLERRGLVERRRLPTDRRTQELHLLPGADDVVAEAQRRATGVTERILEPLGPKDRQRLVALLRRFVTGG